MNQLHWMRCGIAAMGLLWIPASAMATPITGGLQLWLDASDMDGNHLPDVAQGMPPFTDGQTVNTWLDRSGNNNHATGTNQPLYLTPVHNGNPVVQFDGEDDQLAFPRVDAVSVFVLNRAREGVKDLGGLIGLNGADKGIRRGTFTGLGQLGWRGLQGNTTTDMNPDDFTFPDGSEFRVDGVETDLDTVGEFHTVTAIRGGGVQPVNVLGFYVGTREYNGEYAEVLVYDRALDRGEQVQVENYLATKWANPIAVGPLPTRFTWNRDDSGDWNDSSNWSPLQGPSNGINDTTIFGDKITSSRVVFTETNVTVNRVEFNHAQSYFVAGSGSVNLVAGTDSDGDVLPTMSVAAGSHEFQARVNLHSATTLDVSSGSTLIFINAVDLMGNTLNKTGAGEMAIRSDLMTSGGAVNCQQGMCSGSGTISGDLNNDGGIISPGNTAGSLAVVPEPGTLILLALGLFGILGRRRAATQSGSQKFIEATLSGLDTLGLASASRL